ncbi:MAG: hypothetical protein P8Z30_14700 [Acidobacteriota bacterium]
MENAYSLIAVIPCSRFKWTAEIQYMKSLATRDEAIRYASRSGCNLVVKYEKRSGPLFDVLQDPNVVFTSEDSCETVEVVPVLAESESVGWTRFIFRGVFRLAKRIVTGGSTSHRDKAMPSVQRHALAAK